MGQLATPHPFGVGETDMEHTDDEEYYASDRDVRYMLDEAEFDFYKKLMEEAQSTGDTDTLERLEADQARIRRRAAGDEPQWYNNGLTDPEEITIDTDFKEH